MSVSITTPGSVAKVASGAICVKGDLTSGASQVKAKVYHGSVTPPATPPNDAIVGTVSGATFAFDSVSGADHSATTPYPTNTVKVWAMYPANPPRWDSDTKTFEGKTDTKTDCAS